MEAGNGRIVLIAASDAGLAERVARSLPDGCHVRRADSLTKALEVVRALRPSLVVAEERIAVGEAASGDGQSLLECLCDDALPPKIVVVSEREDRQRAAEAIGLGAFDYYVRPIRVEEFCVLMRRALHIHELEAGMEGLPERLSGHPQFRELIGGCPAMRGVFRAVQRVADTDAGVLLVGETGTGKRLLARAVHELSARRSGPFVVLSSGATPSHLVAAEVFGGSEDGNGDESRGGCMSRADGGTLLLDDVCALPAPVQARLAAYLRDRECGRDAGSADSHPDVRLIASAESLHGCGAGGGRLRQDLHYRLGIVTIELPPLRERGEDIAALAHAFMKRYASEQGRSMAGFARSAVASLMSHDWPGNVAELEARVKRAVILSRGRLLSAGDLGLNGNGGSGERSLAEAKSDLERSMVTDALMQAAGNVSRAARAIGVSRPTMYDLMRKYGLELSAFKALTDA